MLNLGAKLKERDISEEPLSQSQIRELIGKDDVADYFNTRSTAFRKMGLEGKHLTKQDMVRLMSQEPNLMKRPIAVKEGKKVIGHDEAGLRGLLS